LFDLRCLSIFAGRIKARLATAKDVGDERAFTARSSKAIKTDLKARELLTLCLAENDRRMARYDARLIRPQLVPTLVRIALKFIR